MPEKENINVNAFMERMKADYSHSKNENIWQLNKILRPFLNEFVNRTIANINTKLTNELGSSSPQFLIISNVDLLQNEIDRFFIQISYKGPDIEFNPLTSPFLLMEFLPNGVGNFLTSNFKSIDKVNNIENIYNLPQIELENKFISSLEKFLDKI